MTFHQHLWIPHKNLHDMTHFCFKQIEWAYVADDFTHRRVICDLVQGLFALCLKAFPGKIMSRYLGVPLRCISWWLELYTFSIDLQSVLLKCAFNSLILLMYSKSIRNCICKLNGGDGHSSQVRGRALKADRLTAGTSAVCCDFRLAVRNMLHLIVVLLSSCRDTFSWTRVSLSMASAALMWVPNPAGCMLLGLVSYTRLQRTLCNILVMHADHHLLTLPHRLRKGNSMVALMWVSLSWLLRRKPSASILMPRKTSITWR